MSTSTEKLRATETENFRAEMKRERVQKNKRGRKQELVYWKSGRENVRIRNENCKTWAIEQIM